MRTSKENTYGCIHLVTISWPHALIPKSSVAVTIHYTNDFLVYFLLLALNPGPAYTSEHASERRLTDELSSIQD